MTANDLIEITPADEYLETRRRVTGVGVTRYLYDGQVSGIPWDGDHFAQVRVDVWGNVNMMAGGARIVEDAGWVAIPDGEGNPTYSRVHSDFTPEQARALAAALIAAADEAESKSD